MLRRERAGYPRRTYRQALRRFLRRNLVGLAFLLVAYVCLLSLLALLVDGYLLGFLQGAATVALAGVVILGFLAASGSMPQLMGAWGEDNTRDVLRWAKRRRLIHGWIDHLEVQSGDVDHLVASASGWIALDSKWHSATLDAPLLANDAYRAAQAGRRAALILRSLKVDASVRPVAVLWGGTRDSIDAGGAVHSGVDFVSGTHLKRWLGDLPTGSMDRDAAWSALKQLRAFRRSIRPDLAKAQWDKSRSARR